MLPTSNKSFIFKPGLSLEQVRSGTIEIWNDRVAGMGIKLLTLIILAQIAGTFFVTAKTPAEIPLFFSRPWGTAQLAPRNALWWLMAGAITVWTIHIILAASMYKQDKIFGRIVVWTGVIILFFVILSLAVVYIRVGSS